MANDLFFLPPVGTAWGQPDRRTALRAAFEQIEARGHETPYQRGYTQFLMFMAAIKAHHDVARCAFVEGQLPSALDRPNTLHVLLEADDVPAPLCVLTTTVDTQTVTGIQPGMYRLKTNLGWVFWEDTLSASDLIWSHAFPGHSLPFAADSGGALRRPSRQVTLLGGSVVLHVYPDVDAGAIEIACRRPEHKP